MKVFIQVTKYVIISFGLFYAIRMFANPPPKTMSKEWQEASNEYALVRLYPLICLLCFSSDLVPWLMHDSRNRKRNSSPSPVSAAKDTRATVSSRVHQPRRSNRQHRISQFSTIWRRTWSAAWKMYVEVPCITGQGVALWASRPCMYRYYATSEFLCAVQEPCINQKWETLYTLKQCLCHAGRYLLNWHWVNI